MVHFQYEVNRPSPYYSLLYGSLNAMRLSRLIYEMLTHMCFVLFATLPISLSFLICVPCFPTLALGQYINISIISLSLFHRFFSFALSPSFSISVTSRPTSSLSLSPLAVLYFSLKSSTTKSCKKMGSRLFGVFRWCPTSDVAWLYCTLNFISIECILSYELVLEVLNKTALQYYTGISLTQCINFVR